MAEQSRDYLCLVGHVVSSGATWCCNRPKGHDGEHDDGLGVRWTDDNPPPMSAVYAAQEAARDADFWFKVAVNTATRAGVYCPRCMHLISAHWPDDERQKPGCHAKDRATPRPCLCSYSPEEVLLSITATAGREHGTKPDWPFGFPAQHLERFAAAEHGSDGLWGYTSMRCDAGIDGCDDKACVCKCHSAEESL